MPVHSQSIIVRPLFFDFLRVAPQPVEAGSARRCSLFLLVFVVFIVPRSVHALTEYHSADDALSVRVSGYIKTLALGLDPSVPGMEDSAEDFTRARLMFEGRLGAYLSWTVHYEHSAVINQVSEVTAGLFTGSPSSGNQRYSLL